MPIKNILTNFLFILSKEDIINNIYIEGGFSLSFIYGIKRNFSNDIDLTVPDIKTKKILIQRIKDTFENLFPENNVSYHIGSNSIIVNIKGINKIKFDIYILPLKYFEWEFVLLNFAGNNFKIKTHTINDILAEKLCNILQKDRCKFKDIADFIKINKKDVIRNQIKFKKIFLKKLKLKSISIKNQAEMTRIINNKNERYRKDYFKYFNNENKCNLLYKEFIKEIITFKLYE